MEKVKKKRKSARRRSKNITFFFFVKEGKKKERGFSSSPSLFPFLSPLTHFNQLMMEDTTLEPLREKGYELGGLLGRGAFSEVRMIFFYSFVERSRSFFFPS